MSDSGRKEARGASDRYVLGAPAPRISPALLALVAEAKPVKTRRPLRAAVGIALLSLAYALALLTWVLGARDDVGSLATLPLLLYAAACLVSFGGLLAAALVPPRGEVLPSTRTSSRLSLLSLTITIPLGILVGVRARAGGAWELGHLADFGAHALPCFLDGLLVAAVPALVGLRALRRLVPRGSWPSALALGGACGILAGLILQFHCPREDLVHVGLAHGSVMLVPAFLLALLGLRVLAD